MPEDVSPENSRKVEEVMHPVLKDTALKEVSLFGQRQRHLWVSGAGVGE